MERFNAFRAVPDGFYVEKRMGLYRANSTFGVHIMFGMYFVIVSGLFVSLLGYLKKKRGRFFLCLCLLGLGVLSSMSTAPIMAYSLMGGLLALYRFRRNWKVFVAVFVAACLLVEVASNSHWYEVAARHTYSGVTAWYRIQLIRVALGGGMNGHWLTGFGLVDPGWGALIDGRGHTDVTNQYVLILITYGILGLGSFAGVLVATFAGLRKAFATARSGAERWLIWSLFSTMLGVLLAGLSVSLFSQTQVVFYIVLACCAMVPNWLRPSGVARGGLSLDQVTRGKKIEKHLFDVENNK